MNEIPEIENKIEALYLYINSNSADQEGDSWYYDHNPKIVSHINSFSKTECEKFVSELWNWKEEIIFDLADPFLNIVNPNLNGSYLYCKLILYVDDIESQEYLVQNIQVVHNIPIKAQPIDFYLDLAKKILIINEKNNQNYNYAVEEIRSKITTEKS
ncbi:hypothetical protein [Flavobacterium sp. LC2016-01]|uniref:hypothetical protein n=1 Tax=Flavobacterium sp. LC2016-01 TaxID=2675876 RepID=UPI0012BA6891|nr:hypothetical protein [Flavobacterium sp. LC2016-01]MTH14132.1 hypothetical protein [Flavobacterium sp. LC2016-01]